MVQQPGAQSLYGSFAPSAPTFSPYLPPPAHMSPNKSDHLGASDWLAKYWWVVLLLVCGAV